MVIKSHTHTDFKNVSECEFNICFAPRFNSSEKMLNLIEHKTNLIHVVENHTVNIYYIHTNLMSHCPLVSIPRVNITIIRNHACIHHPTVI